MPKGPTRWCYVDIGAVRIQTWIDRTPRLRFRRGASNLLFDLTSRSTVESYLPAGVEWNLEAGERSGVVTLRLDGSDVEAARRQALDVAVLVAQRVRQRASALEIVAYLGIASTYAAADMDPGKRLVSADVLLDLPALPTDAVVAKPCDECRSSAAEREPITVAQEIKSLCTDCRSRLDASGATSAADEERRPVSQTQLEEDLRRLRIDDIGSVSTPIDLAALAGMVKHRRSFDASTQIATIAADGNKVGDFMAQLRGTMDEREMTTAIARAARAVVAAGAAELLRRDPQLTDPAGVVSLPVIAHYVGGDDIVVSVPANDAWAFVTTMCGRFAEAIKAELTTTRVAVTLPTLSAGMVFHHRSQPLPDVLAKAHDHLTLAKLATRGDGASVSFLDLTADGDRAVGDRSWAIAELTSPGQSTRSSVEDPCGPTDPAPHAATRM